MQPQILDGDFPAGATLEPSGFMLQDIEIRWVEGLILKSESLKGKIEGVELLDRGSLAGELSDTPEGLTPLEGGIIGGAVTGLNGFLAGYLSLSGNEDAVLFSCYLKDGRYFVAIADVQMFENLQKI